MPYLYKLINDQIVMGKEYDIIAGAENGDLQEVRGAIAEDQEAVNFRDPDTGATAAHISAGDGNRSIVNELLKHDNLDLTITDYWDRTAADMAINGGHHEIADKLMERAFPEFFGDDDPFPEHPQGVTPFPSGDPTPGS